MDYTAPYIFLEGKTLAIFKKEKQEKVALNLQNPDNKRAAIKASLDNKVPLINKGNGVFFVDIKYAKGDRVYNFFKQFISESVNCKQGVIDRDDPKYDYIVIYDLKEE